MCTLSTSKCRCKHLNAAFKRRLSSLACRPSYRCSHKYPGRDLASSISTTFPGPSGQIRQHLTGTRWEWGRFIVCFKRFQFNRNVRAESSVAVSWTLSGHEGCVEMLGTAFWCRKSAHWVSYIMIVVRLVSHLFTYSILFKPASTN